MPAPPRTAFNSSQLVRLLAGLDIGDVAASRQSLAERLSPWLGWSDAIALFGVLDGGPPATNQATGPAARPGGDPATPTVIDEIKRVRRELAQSITDETTFAAALADLAERPDFAPCRRAYRAQQQTMQSRLAPLRGRLRAALAARSTELARLAALDAVLDGALAEREQHLLAQVPGLLERHFGRLRQAQAPDERDPRLAPAQIRQTLQMLLLAELELRLQPAAGLAEALAGQAKVPA